MKSLTAIPALVACALASGAALAGPFDQPYAVFEPALPSAVHQVRPASIMRIDGETWAHARFQPVAPGPHVIEVSVPGPMPRSSPERRTVQIMAKPCTRYAIGARKSIPGSQRWEAFFESEPMGECLQRFAAAGALS